MRNLDPLQYCLDALVYFPQRFADVAAVALAAFSAHRDARGDEQRAVNSLNHLESRNRVRGTAQRIATLGTVLRMQKARLRQLLQDLGQSFGGDAVSISHVFRAQ